MLKRGTRIELGLGLGRVAIGKVLKAQPIAFYSKHGVDLWYTVDVEDADGRFKTTVHHSGLRNIDNRPSFR